MAPVVRADSVGPGGGQGRTLRVGAPRAVSLLEPLPLEQLMKTGGSAKARGTQC